MNISIRERRTKIISGAGPDFPDLEISGAAIDDTVDVFKTKEGGFVVGYLVPDECAEDPFDFDNGLGEIFRANRDAGSEERRQYFRALGRDEYGDAIDAQDDPEGAKGNCDAVMVDCYDHGGQVWSVHGSGMNCAWDTSHGAAVWVPNENILPELEKIKDKDERRTAAVKYAKEALAVFNAWINGECYGVAVDVFDKDGKETEGGDTSYGYYGADDATAALLEMIKAYKSIRGAK